MKLYISGHHGMVGGALVRRFQRDANVELLLRTRRELDLTRQDAVEKFLATEKPDAVIVAAAKVGGIHANNTYPAEFLFQNLAIAANAIHGAYQAGVKRLLFLGSSCIYPKHAPQPMPEDCLLTSALEPTNEAYAIAKIAGLKLCQYYRKQYGVTFHSAMPTNLYGPGDNYHPQNSHVLPALIRRFHEAKTTAAPEVTAWGTGSPMREFLHVDDLADACAYLLALQNPPDWINVGTGTDVTIRELTETVATVVGYTGKITWDPTKPDGTPRKLMDVSRLAALGWRAATDLRTGIEKTYASFLTELAAGRLRAQ
ncbi:GDP-L-fucose synthase [Opitutaceae bacterium TAV4]|uniref:GDP-L-fucose synthase n=1 Tax=Geminisphaera colitermitum TaxID=1148786 RepID=UPI000158CD6B|nr:GDP-L-fucose synthase [Geminisphaera colitermitum]RRJ96415.1 GDP-L-fucose synthase [Opitutaceae bacterium TAV4]RRJ99751.1 GDP-L-fucose synthase [Opitutaceae bacterium TAV3]